MLSYLLLYYAIDRSLSFGYELVMIGEMIKDVAKFFLNLKQK